MQQKTRAASFLYVMSWIYLILALAPVAFLLPYIIVEHQKDHLHAEIAHLVAFLKGTQRGVTR